MCVPSPRPAEKPVARLVGTVLCVSPSFISTTFLSIVVGTVIAAVRFFVEL